MAVEPARLPVPSDPPPRLQLPTIRRLFPQGRDPHAPHGNPPPKPRRRPRKNAMSDHPAEDPALGLAQVIAEDGTSDASRDPFLPSETLLAMFRAMLRVRLLDERMLMRQRQGKVGFYGPSTGQEATPIATAFATDPNDWVFPALREAAVMLVRGFPLTTWIAQVYGNSGDVLKGRQMPMHHSGRDVQQVAWGSCIGTQIPQAVGAAMAARAMHRAAADAPRADAVDTATGEPRMNGDGTELPVVVGFLGDGATSEPDFHHAMGFAKRFAPPVVLICQNNHWSISVPTEKQTASATLAIKARGYGIAAARVDGNDVLAVYCAVKEAVERARSGKGPTFIESVTYRMGPHSSSDDPTRYRSAEEEDRWRKRDPIDRFERYLRKAELLDSATKDGLVAELNEEILAAIRAVEDLPFPRRDSLFDDVYQQRPWHLDEQSLALGALPEAPSH